MENLFSQFIPNTAAEWKAQLVKDLKGVPFEDLVWHNENGFDINPFYSHENQTTKPQPVFSHSSWHMAVRPLTGTDETVNKLLLSNLQNGADAICIELEGRNLDLIFKDIRLDFIHTSVIANAADLTRFSDFVKKHYSKQSLSISCFPANLKTAEDLSAFVKVASRLATEASFVWGANVLQFHNQHCTAALELALVLSQLAEYLHLPEMPTTAPAIRVGVSADYFMQMAKLRALRRLWELFKSEFKSTAQPFVLAETSFTNKTLSDRYNNLLRSTVEAMAAVAGGCNALVVHHFDVLFGTSSALPERMAVNQQHILREESYFDKVADIACGSYYIEHLTDALATEALQIFKTLEKDGGYFAALASGKIDALVKASADAASKDFTEGKQIAIGINKFKNEKEQVNVTEDVLKFINSLHISNPALSFELQQFYSKSHA